MKQGISVLFIISIAFFSCDKSSPPGEEEDPDLFIPTLPNENPGEGTPYTTILEPFNITNEDGHNIYGLIRRPDPEMYPTLSFAAVVKVPGGINPGRMEVLSPELIAMAGTGMVVVGFNAEGRVDSRSAEDLLSEGSEDCNGYRNQNTLARIIEHVLTLPYVIKDNLGIRSQSYGISMATGCAARNPDLPIKYIVDGEGPPESFVTVQEPWALFSPEDHPNHNKYQTVYGILGHYSVFRDSSLKNQAFWTEREAIHFVGQFRGRYLRMQGMWDHSQPPGREIEIPLFHQPPVWWHGKHTCDIVNAAVEGGVPWVRVNLPEQGNEVNAKYSSDNLPVFIPGELNDKPMLFVRAVVEMARMEQ